MAAFLWQKAPQAEDSNCEQLNTHHPQLYHLTEESNQGPKLIHMVGNTCKNRGFNWNLFIHPVENNVYFSLNIGEQPPKLWTPNSQSPGGPTHVLQNGSCTLDSFLTAADSCPAWLCFTSDQVWKQIYPSAFLQSLYSFDKFIQGRRYSSLEDWERDVLALPVLGGRWREGDNGSALFLFSQACFFICADGKVLASCSEPPQNQQHWVSSLCYGSLVFLFPPH